MLKIRKSQIEAFQPVAEVNFINRIVDYLKQNHSSLAIQLPEGLFLVEQLSTKALQNMVNNGIERARKYNMKWESSIASYIMLMFIASPNFDEHPLIERILSDEKISPETRIDQLWEHTSEQNWEAVKQRYDANSWYKKQ